MIRVYQDQQSSVGRVDKCRRGESLCVRVDACVPGSAISTLLPGAFSCESPKARETAKVPCTRPLVTKPPDSAIRATSSGSEALRSMVRSIATPVRL